MLIRFLYILFMKIQKYNIQHNVKIEIKRKDKSRDRKKWMIFQNTSLSVKKDRL